MVMKKKNIFKNFYKYLLIFSIYSIYNLDDKESASEIISSIYNNSYGQLKKQSLYGFIKDNVNLYNLISSWEKKFFLWNGDKNNFNILDMEPYVSFWDLWVESLCVEVALKNLIMILKDLMSVFALNIRDSDVYNIINKKNYQSKLILYNDNLIEHFSKMITLLNMNNQKSIIYIYGPPGTGKSTITIQELVRNNFKVYYFNINKILFSKNEQLSIISVLQKVFDIIIKDSKKNKKVVVVLDDCEKILNSLMILREKMLKKTDVNSIISNNMFMVQETLTIFFLYILSQRQFPVVLISNSHANFAEAISRRINYTFKVDIPNRRSLLYIWKIFFNRYKVTFFEGPCENFLFFISNKSIERRLSIRDIQLIVMSFSNKKISIKDLIKLINSRNINE